MKPLIWAALLAGGTAAAAPPECAHINREHYVGGWEQADAMERIHERITPDGVIECRFLPDSENRLNILARYEQGTLDGSGYRVYYGDGSAVIQGRGALPADAGDAADSWRMTCKQADDDGAYGCTLVKGELRLYRDTRGHQTIGVGEDYREGSELLIRVHGHPAVIAPVAGGFSATQTEQLLAQMHDATQADIGFHRAPLQGATEKPLSLAGFNPAMTVMERVLAQLQSTPPANAAANPD